MKLKAIGFCPHSLRTSVWSEWTLGYTKKKEKNQRLVHKSIRVCGYISLCAVVVASLDIFKLNSKLKKSQTNTLCVYWIKITPPPKDRMTCEGANIWVLHTNNNIYISGAIHGPWTKKGISNWDWRDCIKLKKNSQNSLAKCLYIYRSKHILTTLYAMKLCKTHIWINGEALEECASRFLRGYVELWD